MLRPTSGQEQYRQILWGKERIPQGKRSGVYQGTEFCEGTKCLGLVLNSGFSEQFLGRKVDQGKIYMGFSYVVHTKQKLFHRQWCTRNIFFLNTVYNTVFLPMLIYYSWLCRGIYKTGNRSFVLVYFSVYHLNGNNIDDFNLTITIL